MFLSFVIIFILGLIVGSGLNALIYRLEISNLKSFFKKRSVCPHCKHSLAWYDLVPLVSFVLLAGRCRYCKKKISWQYPLVELSTALLFASLWLNNPFIGNWKLEIGNLITFLVPYFFVSVLIVIFVIDFKHQLILDKITYPAIGIIFLANFFRPGVIWRQALLSAVIAGLAFASIISITRGKGMGWGDVKLAFLLGLYFSFPLILVAIFLGFIFGGIVGAVLLLLKKKTLKSKIAFGPFLVLGAIITIFFGQQILFFYFSLLGL